MPRCPRRGKYDRAPTPHVPPDSRVDVLQITPFPIFCTFKQTTKPHAGLSLIQSSSVPNGSLAMAKEEVSRSDFPHGFVFGVATSAYQVTFFFPLFPSLKDEKFLLVVMGSSDIWGIIFVMR